jgi:DtxR family Mn-dependent transcriptional regulator
VTDTISLTPALEDYLEAMWEIHAKGDAIRVTDIAEKLDIAKSTVSQTINKLKNLKLVMQESYGPIYLTSLGKKYAEKVRNRHLILRSFLIEVLEVDYQTAEKDACLMEHVLSSKTMEKLAEFIANTKTKQCSETGGDGKLNRDEKGEGLMKSINTKALSKLQIGEKGKVIRITAQGPVRRRILEMGVIPGTEISVKGVAPLGDPVELMVKGYRLSLRKEEADDVIVEVL